MLRVVAGVTLLALGTSLALAQNTAVIKERQDLMKANADALKAPTAMMKGEAPFELTKVQASLKTLQDLSLKLKPLWPENSKTGGNTRALPAIWKDVKEYVDWFDGMAADAKSAAEAIKDEATFKAEWPKVVDYCGSCHRDYRAPAK
jgi:cytochrome c556